MVEAISKDIRAAIFADTHGNVKAVRQAVRDQGPFDILIHLGDGANDGRKVSKEFQIPFYGVAGNEDWDRRLPEKRLLKIHEWSFLLLHGHQTEINPYQDPAIYEGHLHEMRRMARMDKARVLLFGHTHRPLLRQSDGVIMCNPGEQHLGSTNPPTFALMTVSRLELDICVFRKQGPNRWTVHLNSGWRASDSSRNW